MNYEEIINKLGDIITELDARNNSHNCVIPHLLNKSWDEICKDGCELFEKLQMKEEN
ncbi:hypothetical protein [uncultured Eubacterium sp.]|mgnify:CR=1 FL=1|uniref:hypothetical protein n=1 Tax=uncultured Eubacterium sp. TaxID=165185 RepID=UPI0025968499|nr:hypothetical protein [uncultured Eubacterium sp.]